MTNERVGAWILRALVIVTFADASLFVAERYWPRPPLQLLRGDPGRQMPVPRVVGWSADERPGEAQLEKGTKGWVVRYFSTQCSYCMSDDVGTRLAKDLHASGFPVTILAPSPSEVIADESVVAEGMARLSFISMDWIRQVRLNGTPSLLIFDFADRLIWFHQGRMNEATAAAARRAAGLAASIVPIRSQKAE